MRFGLFQAMYWNLPEGRRLTVAVCFEVLQTNLSDASALEKMNDPKAKKSRYLRMPLSST